ncbi:serine/threonine-protein kinase [Aeoliella mucimassa]|uniref:non-specific serine/threonine protein kinase n=1 Tax=Aeoliella mucimassa TaxID=2527972 RepID=A0A518ARD2_9BACT|nr:serine/threonine-protein kinase [Aeoliella mucimassa]QDU57283.1 Serine/threonine-protein kinase PknB [Aeoliella mucimassa]
MTDKTPTPESHPPADDATVAGQGARSDNDPTASFSEDFGHDDDLTTISMSPPIDYQTPFSGLKPYDLGRALVGHQLDDVVLEEFVGGGGMGAVLRGRDTVLHRTVAVKVLSTHQAGDEETAKRFQMEARSAARLDHPCIARVYYVGENRGLRYIIFEYIEGINVRDLVAQSGPLSISDTVSYSLQIADALTHAWQRSVVHRDIKPSNILITADGQAKLVDMGLARMHEVGATAPANADEDLTATGMTIGTFDYIAPEQARSPRDADTRSDIYSLGCTMYYMLTGRPPFPGGTPLQKLLSHQGDPPPMLAELRPDVPAPLAAVVGRMLAKRPEQRYQTPADLTTALLNLSDQLGVIRPGLATTLIPSIPKQPTRVERNLPWLAPIALLLIGIGLLSLFWHPSEPTTDLDAAPLVTQQAAEKARELSP